MPLPKHVLSTKIKNTTSEAVQCTIMYCGDNVHHETENVNVTIEPNGGEYFADIKKFTVSSNSFQDNQKSIYKIVATKSDGTKLEVRQPFDDVPGSAPKNWLFEIRDKEIKSIDPKKSGQ